MVKNILLVGAGRMGQRHLLGLKEFEHGVTVVDINSNCLQASFDLAKKNNCRFELNCHSSLEFIPPDVRFDAVIISATADCRLEHLEWVAGRGIQFVLLEKPFAQSRDSFNQILNLVDKNKIDVCCNLYRRKLVYFDKVRRRLSSSHSEVPLTMIVSSGAMGLACNGIHWIDFAFSLTGAKSGKLVYGDIQSTSIASGRGPQFNDYGGTGIFELSDGSRLILNVIASSSAPTSVLIYESKNMLIVDQKQDIGIEYNRDPHSQKPDYLYGMDYFRNEVRNIETFDLSVNTSQWLQYLKGNQKCPLPKLQEVMISHALMFDLLEKGGAKQFKFT